MTIRFIVTGMGRSGTLWLSRLLDEDVSLACHHEPLAQYDARHYAKVHDGQMEADEAVQERLPRMEKIAARHLERDYAEVNSHLRYYVPALKRALPDTRIAGLVRDGRLVVRSLMARGCYQKPGYPPIRPPMDLGAFASCCWYWADAYWRLIGACVKLWHLEQLNASYDYFLEMCYFLHTHITHEQWQRFAGVPMNVDVGEEPLEWTDHERAMFRLLAGNVQDALGYEC